VVRVGIVVGYVAVAAVLVTGAVAIGSGEIAGFAFIAFGVASLVFGSAFLRYAPWRCWNCMSRNPARRSACASCGITHEESDRLAEDAEGD
jgi:hypothetical protein